MEGWCEWASVKVKGASHWPTPLCLDLLLLFTQFVTSALWDQYYRQHVGGEGSPNKLVQVSAGAHCPRVVYPSSLLCL